MNIDSMNRLKDIENKILDHLESVDLKSITQYDLLTYIQAYKTLVGYNPFLGCSSALGLATDTAVK